MSLRPIAPPMIAVLVCVALAGCVPPVSGAVPSTSSSPSAPIFATDEEALAAATKAYGDYLAIADKVGGEGGVEVERISPYVTKKYLQSEAASYADLRSERRQLVGSTSFIPVKIQRSISTGGLAVVEAYVCVDVSKIRVLDAGKIDVTPADKSDRYPILLGLRSDVSNPKLLKLDSSQIWKGKNYC